MQLRLRQVREDRGVSQLAVALAVGCTRAAISHWECGRQFPSLAMVQRLADALGVSEARLLSLDTTPGTVCPTPRARAS